MKYFDELIAAHPRMDGTARKFVLSQLQDQIPDAQGHGLVDFLWTQVDDPAAEVSSQARRAMGQFVPAQMAYEMRLSLFPLGAWSEMLLPPNRSPGTESPPNQVADLNRQELAARGLARALCPALSSLAGLLRSPDHRCRTLASMILGGFAGTQAFDTMLQAPGWPLDFNSSAALAESGNPRAFEVLRNAVERSPKESRDLLLLLSLLPQPGVLDWLRSREATTDAAGRMNIAQALSAFPGSDCRDVLERLIRRREAWVTAQALNTLELDETPDLDLIELGWRLETHEFVRIQAVRAAGSVGTAAAQEFCLKALATSVGSVQAMALDSLARLKIVPDELARIVRPSLQAAFVGTRVRAILITSRVDPEWASDAVGQMILATDPLVRREGAFVLGYLRTPGACDMLARMASTDPSRRVRTRAIQALARHDPIQALPQLHQLLCTADPGDWPHLGRALAGFPAEVAPSVVTVVSQAIQARPDPESVAVMLRGLGRAVAQNRWEVPALLVDGLRHTDPGVVAAALDGLRPLGDQIPIDAVSQLESHDNVLISTLAALTSVASGQLESLDLIARNLRGTTPDRVHAPLQAMWELVSLVRSMVASGRFQKLTQRLCSEKVEGAGVETTARPPTLAPGSPPGPRRSRRLPAADQGIPRSPRILDRGPGSIQDRYARARPRMARAVHLSHFTEWLREWRAGRTARAVTAGVVGLALVTWFAWGSAGAGQRAERPHRTWPRVWSATGPCEVVENGTGPRSLVVGEWLRARARVSTGSGASVRLVDLQGNEIALGPSSTVRLIQRPPHAPRCEGGTETGGAAATVSTAYSVEAVTGSVRLEFVRGAVEIKLEGGRVALCQGALQLEGEASTLGATLLVGAAVLDGRTGQRIPLTPRVKTQL